MNKLQCAAFLDEKNKQKIIITASTEKMTYAGVENRNNLCNTVLLIRNKKSGKVRTCINILVTCLSIVGFTGKSRSCW